MRSNHCRSHAERETTDGQRGNQSRHLRRPHGCTLGRSRNSTEADACETQARLERTPWRSTTVTMARVARA